MFRSDLSWNGATLAERLAHVRGRAANVEATFSDRESAVALENHQLAPWARACALGDADALRRRLAWDGIEVPVACAAMAAEAPADFPPAAWVDQLSELVAGVPGCAAEVGTSNWDREIAEVEAGSPFADVWLPVLRAARKRLTRTVPAARDWLSEESTRALHRQLIRELARLGELAVFEDFRASVTSPSGEATPEGYQRYVRQLLESGYEAFFGVFPVLARQIVMVVNQWVDQIGTLIGRLSADRDAIASTFGSEVAHVRRLMPGLSDRHAGGCRVAFVEFASGLRLAYKPRDVRLECSYNEWLRQLRREGLADVPPALRVLDRGTHGWVEWVEQGSPASADAVRAYFRSAGALACLAYVLGGTDLHSENVVATTEGPVLVDAEMFLQPSTGPRLSADASADEEDTPGVSTDSCLSSGLLCFVVVDRNGKEFDVGGLRPAVSRELAVPMRRWLNLRRDDIRFVPEQRVHPVLRNDVRVNGDNQRPEDFAADVRAGFESTYRFLESNRAAWLAADGPLRGFADCRTRVLFRPSDQYAAAQYVMAAPRYQRSGLDRSLAIETFHRVFIRDMARPRIWPLVHDERQALEALDIPRQTLIASAVDLEASTGEVVHDYYARSGVEAARGRLRAFTPEDMAWQVDQLCAALEDQQAAPAIVQGDVANEIDESAGKRALIAAAEQIGVALLRRANQGPDGSLRWVSSRGRADLYGGASGVGLFLAALAVITRRETWRDAARQAFDWMTPGSLTTGRPEGSRIGACTGRPSVAYVLALSGHLLEDERLTRLGVELARAIPHHAVETDAAFDIEGGAGGALVALLAVHDMRGDDQLIALASRCASRLLAAQVQTGPDRGGWRSGDSPQARAGFAHGAAGIACALSRWAPHAAGGAGPVFDAVREAHEFERRVFAEAGAWPVVRGDGRRIVMAAWCHGAPGIALARACAPAEMAEARVGAEIDSAMRQTLAAPHSKFDHLCCGNLGRADVALTVGLRTGDETWAESGRTMARAVAARVLSQGRLGMRGRGFQMGATAPEFFQGLAGIGYQLLRASAPSVLPSVLAFDSPATAQGGRERLR